MAEKCKDCGKETVQEIDKKCYADDSGYYTLHHQVTIYYCTSCDAIFGRSEF